MGNSPLQGLSSHQATETFQVELPVEVDEHQAANSCPR
jgi:hypothetical protein